MESTPIILISSREEIMGQERLLQEELLQNNTSTIKHSSSSPTLT